MCPELGVGRGAVTASRKRTFSETCPLGLCKPLHLPSPLSRRSPFAAPLSHPALTLALGAPGSPDTGPWFLLTCLSLEAELLQPESTPYPNCSTHERPVSCACFLPWRAGLESYSAKSMGFGGRTSARIVTYWQHNSEQMINLPAQPPFPCP